jgi:hypothetical protein
MIALPLNFIAAVNIFRAINVIRSMDAANALSGRADYFPKKQFCAETVVRN